jgi:hypothetical protein
MVGMLQDFLFNAGKWMPPLVPVELLSDPRRYFSRMDFFLYILDTVKELI